MTATAINVIHALDCEIPCIKVETIDHSNAGYLMPFRAYRFQVCGTVHGEGDLGSSDVKQFREIIKMMPEIAFIDWMREQAIIALMRWNDNYRYGISMTNDEEEIFEAFLQECYDWVKSLG